MWRGSVVSINLAPERDEPMQPVDEVRAVAGRGLEGDRYFNQTGTYSDKPGPDRHVTLIEIESINALKSESGLEIEPGDARRNIVTRDVPLNHLVGREFKVGEVILRGIRLCEPCAHLASLTHPKVLPGLIHRGGLRAQVLTGGTIRAGDDIRPAESQ
jgi:MOSC domain-containing protein YiiM